MRYMTAADGRAAFELGQRLGRLGVLAIGCDGDGPARVLARTVGCGAALAGADVLFHDGTTPAAGVWVGKRYRLPAAVYLLGDGERAALYLHDGGGVPLAEETLPVPACQVGPVGNWDQLVGTDCSFAARRAADIRTGGLVAAVLPGPGQGSLVETLERMECEVVSRPRAGVPLLRCSRDGFSLTVRDGEKTVTPPGVDGLAAAAAWCLARSRGEARPAFGPEEAPRLL